MNKLASFDRDFEQSFFQLAYDKLQGKLHNLLPFLIGFEIVNKSDDNTKAIGVFGFKSGNGQIVFVPAFFANGKVKELDVLYSRNNSQFYPLNEDYAELFLKDDVTGLGDVADSKRDEIIQDNPPNNFRNTFQPPRTGKYSYAEAKENLNKEAGQPTFDSFFLLKDKIASEISVLDYISKADNNVKAAAWRMLETTPDYTEALRRFYTDDEISNAFIPKEAKVKKRKVKFYNTIESAKDGKLPLEKKKDLVTKGYTIVDEREEKEKTKFGKIQIADKYTNPPSSGFYPYVTELGSIRYGLVLIKPETFITGFSLGDKAIVLDLEAKVKGQCYLVDKKQVFVKDQISVQEYSEVFSMLEEPAEALPSYDTYVMINEALNVTEPFRVLLNSKDHNGIRRIQIELERHVFEQAEYVPTEKKIDNKFFSAPHQSKVTLVITKRTGNTLEHKGTVVYVPKGYKLLKIKPNCPYNYNSARCCSSPSFSTPNIDNTEEINTYKAGKPGGLHAIMAPLYDTGVMPMTVHSNGSEYFVTLNQAKKKYECPIKAKIGMVMDFGFDEKDAEELVDSLIPDVPVNGTVKFAVMGENNIPLIDEAPTANELGQPTYYGTPYEGQLPSDTPPPPDPTRMGLGVKPDVEGLQSEVQKAVDLAAAGQKSIFDTQSIATLSKYIDPSAKVTEYIPNFVSTLDNLGRMLFMIYWETEKFQEMYGKDELPELIEMLKDVFKNLGDLVIFLKRKFPDLSINGNEHTGVTE